MNQSSYTTDDSPFKLFSKQERPENIEDTALIEYGDPDFEERDSEK